MRYTYFVEGSSYAVGDKVLVYSRTNPFYGKECFYIAKRFAETGYPGNLDGSIRKFHGWRGTTDNVSIYAYGVYEVKSISYDEHRDLFKVVIGKKDLAEGKD